MKGLRRSNREWFIFRCLLEISPVYEGIKTIKDSLWDLNTQLEISPVYEGIKTKVS